MGFTIAIALPRFDQRRQLEIEEANSIGTTRLRAELLPEPQRTRSLELLREYIDVRIEFGKVGRVRADMNRNTQRTNALQAQIWQQTVAVAREHPTPVTTAYIASLNETIDITESRLAAFENRVPHAVWLIVIIVALFQSFVTGFSLQHKLWFPVVVTPAVIAVVLALVADLDSPRTGLILVEQLSMGQLAPDATSTAK